MFEFKFEPNHLSVEFDGENKELLDFLEIWQSKRVGGQLPSRADIGPFELRRHLGWVVLIDVERPLIRFKYRLVGTNITEISGRDVTGLYFEDAYGPDPSGLLKIYKEAFEAAKPCHVVGRYPVPGKDFYQYEAMILPLADNNVDVDKFLVRLFFHRP